jgi:DNA polymerase III epsilon subunit-like protein
MYLVYDTETAGLPQNWKASYTDTANWPRLVQMAWSLLDERYAPIESVNRIVRPDGFSIPSSASRIHGITTQDAMTRGWPLATVLGEFYSALQRAAVVAAHNFSFDGNVVAAEFVRCGWAFPFEGKRQVCTMVESTDFCELPGPYGNKWPTLEELHSVLFSESFQDAHDAGVDAAAATRCFVELRRLGVVVV